ncbi:MAG: radical SAM protein [Anaerolineae bacterium]
MLPSKVIPPTTRTVVDLRVPGVDGRVTLSLKRDATTLAVNTVPSFTFDLKGRLMGGFADGRTYRRTLDHRVIEKRGEYTEGRRERERREISADEVRTLCDTAYGYAQAVGAALAAGTAEIVGVTGDDGWQAWATASLDSITRWDDARLAADAEEFLRIYRPIGILPPDQYRALVLQATLGCSYNRCTFCTFYRGQSFRIKLLPDFERHIAAVRTFHGAALASYHSIFLGEANALVAPQRLLLPMLDAVNAAFPVAPWDLSGAARARWLAEHSPAFDGVYAFVSALDALRKSPSDIAEMRKRGLRRVYIGLESGDEGLLRFLEKPNTAAQAVEGVESIKAGGVAVGVVIMLGVGGERYAADHVAHTVEVLNSMGLGGDDILYFSEFVETPGLPYSERAAREGIAPMPAPAVRAQRALIQGALRFRDTPPKLAVYDIREFAY